MNRKEKIENICMVIGLIVLTFGMIYNSGALSFFAIIIAGLPSILDL